MSWRAVFDAEVTFSNEGGLQAQGFRVDVPGPDVTDAEIGRLFVTSLDLLMADTVTVRNVRFIEEEHKGTRGGPSDPRRCLNPDQGDGTELVLPPAVPGRDSAQRPLMAASRREASAVTASRARPM